METLWKVRQRNVLCDKKKSFKLALEKKKIIGFKLCLKIKKCSKMTSANLTLVLKKSLKRTINRKITNFFTKLLV